MTEIPPDWDRPIPHWSTDPFAGCTTLHGLATDEVRSALHKHVRQGNIEQSVRAAMELARTDADHEEMLWQRLSVIAAEDIGLGDPTAITVVAALRDSARSFDIGSYERLEFAAQAAGFLATAPKDPIVGEVMQVVLREDRVPDIPDEALCIHTRRGQELGRTLHDWFVTGTRITPEVEGRDTSWHEYLEELYARLDPPR
jgi:hypothetical protein